MSAERPPSPNAGPLQAGGAPGLAPEAARAIAEGRHGDPFAVLGPHLVDGTWWVRAFDPGAEHMRLVPAGGGEGFAPVEMRPVAGAPGLFVGALPKGGEAPTRYLIEGRAGEARWQTDDPYRFGPVLGELDDYLVAEGTLTRLWHALGAHAMRHEGADGVHFAVWAPNAERVALVGEHNFWDARRQPMRRRISGVWEIFVPGLGEGLRYKYHITGPGGEVQPLKADPVGFGAEHPPATASVVRELRGHAWADGGWMGGRGARQAREAPISIYEVHLGSWRRHIYDGNRMLTYEEAAESLVAYVRDMGFTHIEFLPLSEYPFDGSWGYQPIGLYAPTARHGTPEGLRALVEAAHGAGLGVIMDWVPAHFPTDAHGLRRFDGTPLYEYADPREGFHRDWNTLIYNFGRIEVREFLVANALYWLEEYHLDGLRVDAVASMLYRDYSRPQGEWVPNEHGGRENLEAIAFLQQMNRTTYGEAPGSMTAAEESTAFPGVTRPVHLGGLGFGYKWNMGWMNDTLDYMSRDPIYRKYHHHQMTFGMVYAFSENFILPISHDEVVHGKGSMLGKMPGGEWEKFANLRAYYGFMWGHPGKKLLFMGCEFGQASEWNHDRELAWDEAERPLNAGLRRLVRDLNTLYRAEPALHAGDCVPEGFAWLDADDAERSILAWARFGGADHPPAVVVCNFTPVPRQGVVVGMPRPGRWREALNTDAGVYGGGNRGHGGAIETRPAPAQGQPQHALLDLPPLSTLIFVHDPKGSPDG